MNLHPNSAIKMDYSPATDILYVEYPDLENYLLPAIKQGLVLLVETIRNYDVKKLVLDASKTAVTVSDEENREVNLLLASELAKTRLRKVARIRPSDPIRETKAQQNIHQMHQAGLFPYHLETFNSREAAVAWLQADV